MSRISALKNKIKKLENKIIKTESTFTFQYAAAKEREIIELKQEGQCKQIIIDSLEWQLDRRDKNLKDVAEVIDRLNRYIKDLEDRKFKNRLKKLLAG